MEKEIQSYLFKKARPNSPQEPKTHNAPTELVITTQQPRTIQSEIEQHSLYPLSELHYLTWLYDMESRRSKLTRNPSLFTQTILKLTKLDASYFEHLNLPDTTWTVEQMDILWRDQIVPVLERKFCTLDAVTQSIAEFSHSKKDLGNCTATNMRNRAEARLSFINWLENRYKFDANVILAYSPTIAEIRNSTDSADRILSHRLKDFSPESIRNILDRIEAQYPDRTDQVGIRTEFIHSSSEVQVNATRLTRNKEISKIQADRPVMKSKKSDGKDELIVPTPEARLRTVTHGRRREIEVYICYRCKSMGHTAVLCTVFVPIIKNCPKCGKPLPNHKCEVPKEHRCKRYGCQGNHYASQCPVNFLPGQIQSVATYECGAPTFVPTQNQMVNMLNAFQQLQNKVSKTISRQHGNTIPTVTVNNLNLGLDDLDWVSADDPCVQFLRGNGYSGEIPSTGEDFTAVLNSVAVFGNNRSSVVVEEMNDDNSEIEIDQQETNGVCAYSRLLFYSKANPNTIKRNALLDTGASCNVISLALFKLAFAKQLFTAEEYVQHRTPQQVGLANGTQTSCPGHVTLRFKVNGVCCKAPFLVMPTCQHDVIIGMPGLKTFFKVNLEEHLATLKSDPKSMLNLIHSNASEPATSVLRDAPVCVSQHSSNLPPVNPKPFLWIEKAEDQGQTRLMVRCPLYEDARMEPIREGSRTYSDKQKKMLVVIFEEMVKAGKVAEISLEQAKYTCPLVLVDKQKGLAKPPQWPCPKEELIKRFRVTLDLRGLNQAQLLIGSDGLVYLVPKRLTGKMPPDNHTTYQYQPAVWDMLRSLNAENCVSYGKIDLSDAYSSVQIPEAMQGLFCTELALPGGGSKFYSWLVLAQGWKMSPSVFRMVEHLVTFEVVQMVTARLGRQAATIFYLQDDTLVAGSSSEVVTFTMNCLIETFERYGFKVNRDKCTQATPTIPFCGYQLDGPKMSPTATRERFSMEIATSIIGHLRNHSVARVKHLRTLAGKLNFLYRHFRVEVRCHLQTLQEAINSLTKDKHAGLNIEKISEAVTQLVDYACHRVPGLCLMNFQATHATLIIFDANQTSWSAVCLAIVTLPSDSNETKYGDSSSFLAQVKDIPSFPVHLIPKDSVAIPVRIVGGRFTLTQQKQSSTYRERGAMILSVYELQADLAGPVIVACDNQNCSKTWHDVDEMFTGEWARKYTIFEELHHCVVWIPKTVYPV